MASFGGQASIGFEFNVNGLQADAGENEKRQGEDDQKSEERRQDESFKEGRMERLDELEEVGDCAFETKL